MKLPFASYIPSQVNPIVVKELRQAVRSRFVSAMFLLFLLAQLVGIGMFLAEDSSHHMRINYYAGRETFHFLYIALSTTCITFIPVYAAVRLSIERWDNNMDLMYITTITPRQIIRGKLLSSMTIAILLLSASAPFMFFSYILRGIDIPSIATAIIFIILFVTAITQAMIFVACLPTSKVFKIILGLATVMALIWSIVIINMVGWEIIYKGTGSRMYSSEFWITCAYIGGGIWLAVGLLQRMAVALISPPTSNRMLPVRRYIFITWLITGIATSVYACKELDEDIMLVWFIPATMFISATLLFGLGESDKLSLRVKRTIPRGRLARTIAFPFFNGPASSLVFSIILILLSTVLIYLTTELIGSCYSSSFTNAITGTISFAFYSIAYGLTALTIWRKFLSRRLRPAVIGVLAILMIIIGAFLPSVVALITNSGSNWRPAWYVGNIFTVWSWHRTSQHIIFSAFWAAVMVVINIKWIGRQFREFTPTRHE